jgi:hypothetical protein
MKREKSPQGFEKIIRGFLSINLCVCLFVFLFIGSAAFEEKSRPEKWIEDIDQLAQELPAKHKNLYAQISEKDFIEQIEKLKRKIPDLSDEELIFRLSCLVASFGDAHTSLNVMPRQAFPFTLGWFREGIHVINTLPEYEKILYCRLLKINDHSIEEVISTLSKSISHENEAQIKRSMPYSLIQIGLLLGAKVIDDPESALFTFQKDGEAPFSVKIVSMSMKEKFNPIITTTNESDLPLYRRNRKLFYSYFYLEDEKTLYFLYNSCRVMKDKPFPDFVKEVFDVVDQNGVQRFIVDLRNNGGGNSGIFFPMTKELKLRDDLNKKNRLFVILGRGTFSSAVLNAIELKNQTHTTFVGEPTGGKPNHFGEVRNFTLKNSKLNVSYSTKYFTHAEEDTDSLYPDIRVELSVHDYINKKDPVLEKILRVPWQL